MHGMSEVDAYPSGQEIGDSIVGMYTCACVTTTSHFIRVLGKQLSLQCKFSTFVTTMMCYSTAEGMNTFHARKHC